jgi:GNAT superfamily N-acetyltransferase
MSIEIRPLDCEHLDEALQVWEVTLGNGFKLDRQEVADRLQNDQGLFYIALDDETGCIVGIKFGYIDGEVCLGRGIGVLPEYRRQGIATRLVRTFEQGLRAIPAVNIYAFGSGTTEGVPFHIAMGYTPQVLVQFTDCDLRHSLDFSGFAIAHEGYNEQYQTYQIFTALDAFQSSLEFLRSLQTQFPQVNVQFFFEKKLEINGCRTKSPPS